MFFVVGFVLSISNFLYVVLFLFVAVIMSNVCLSFVSSRALTFKFLVLIKCFILYV